MASPKTKKLFWTIGAFAIICGLPLFLVMTSVSNLFDASASNEADARENATLSQIVAKLATRRKQGMTPEETASLYLTSGSGSLARAEIQDRSAKLVQEAGGRLVEAQLTGTPEQEADGTVAIQLTLDIDNKGLFDLLYAIETGLPLISVTGLSATSNNGPNESRRAGNSLLHVEMTMEGRFRKSTG